METQEVQNVSIEISPAHREIVKGILQKHLLVNTHVFVYGSRAKNKARRGSDLDLAIDLGCRMTLDLTTNLATDFEESDLPYTVDVLDLQTVAPSFLALVKPDFIELDWAK